MLNRHNPERSFGKILDHHDSSRTGLANITSIAYHGKVINNDDPKNSKRIQVKINGIDDNTPDEQLPWCISLMPNFFFYVPQKSEHVIIFITNPWNKNYGRLYLGPIQTGNFREQSYDESMPILSIPTFKENNE